MSYGLMESAQSAGPCIARSVTMKDRIDQAIAISEQQLTAARRARDILNEHPEIEELLNLLQRF